MAINISKRNLIASICRDSFYDFFLTFWETIVPETLVPNWHIKYLCDELQIVAERVFAGKPKEYDLLINISPGTTKSTICSIMYPAWMWTRMPSIRCICGSYAGSLSMELSRKSRLVIKSQLYTELYPEIYLSNDQDTKGHFANTAGGSRYATSVGGSVMGMHGHVIVIDDPIDPQSARSDTALEDANTWIETALPTRKVDKAVTPTILIMQRLHQSDPSGKMMEQPNVKHICLPATESDLIKPKVMRKFYTKGLMDTERLSRKVLAENERMLGQYHYAGQFNQNPIPDGGGMFKIVKLKLSPLAAIKIKTGKLVRYWDKAGSHNRGCYTVGVKMCQDIYGGFWVLDVVRGQWESQERERIIKETTELDGKECIVWIEQEPGSGGLQSAQDTIRNLAGYSVYAERPSGDKTLRADPFSVQVNNGNVGLATAMWNGDYMDEMQFFPDSTYKDQMDASSGAFGQLCVTRRVIGALGHGNEEEN